MRLKVVLQCVLLGGALALVGGQARGGCASFLNCINWSAENPKFVIVMFLARLIHKTTGKLRKKTLKEEVEYKEKIVMDHSYYEMHLYKVRQ